MTDFMKVIGNERKAFRCNPRYMEVNLGGTENPLESNMHICHSMMHIIPRHYARRGVVRIPIYSNVAPLKPMETIRRNTNDRNH